MIRTAATLTVLACSGLLVAGFRQAGATDEPGTAQALTARADPAAPAYGLHYLDMGDTVRLAYGMETSDAVRLMLDCERGAGRIDVSDNAVAGDRIVLSAGEARTVLRGEVGPGVMAPVVFASASADQPALQAFRREGRIVVGEGANRYAVDATAGEERRAVETFFRACTA